MTKHAIALETYAINLSQAVNMFVLSFSVPWVIGLENYGLFAAAFALPGIVQSFTEALILILLARGLGGRRSISFALAVYLPPATLLFLVWYLAWDAHLILPSLALLAVMLWRTILVAPAMFSGGMKTQIVISECIISVCYLAVLAGFVIQKDTSVFLPFVMILVALAISTLYLGYHVYRNDLMASLDSKAQPQAPMTVKLLLSLGLARSYEDSFLTILPLILAQSVSAYFAGQFRVLVSVVKAAYKLFPLRYEIALREFRNHTISVQYVGRLAACAIVFFPIICAFAAMVLKFDGTQAIWLLVVSGGITIPTLALFPVAYSFRPVLALYTIAAMAAVVVAAVFGGEILFSIAYGLANAVILAMSLAVLGRESKPPIAGA